MPTDSTTQRLYDLGLDDYFLNQLGDDEALFVGRISVQNKDNYKIITEDGEFLAKSSGKILNGSHYPVVGDWVLVDKKNDATGHIIIHKILNRKSCFSRKAAGTSHDIQIIASNIDIVFICMALNNDFNLRRLERYISAAWDSGATPVVVLTKSDLCGDMDDKVSAVSTVAMGVDVLVTNSISSDGYIHMMKYIQNGTTVAFVGSSGVGKSTLINRLMGENVLTTNETRNDDRGRHTTTHRQLFLLKDGGVVIDTPGMRELQLSSADFEKSFSDVEDLASQCRYADCTHNREPACAVQGAIQNGTLDQKRLESYNKLKTKASYENLDSKAIEKVKLSRMFGGKNELKQFRNELKKKR